MIGATWISYLSSIGFRSGQDKADGLMKAGKKETAETMEAFKKNILEKVDNPEMKVTLSKVIYETNVTVQKKWDVTGQMVRRHKRNSMIGYSKQYTLWIVASDASVLTEGIRGLASFVFTNATFLEEGTMSTN